MYGRTTILVVVATLLCLLAYPLQGNPSFVLHSSGKMLPLEQAQADLTENKSDQVSPYLLVRGKVSMGDQSRLPGGYFHLDVYKSSVGEKKLLVRTSRYQGDIYKVYLSRGFDHTLIFKVENFPYFELHISAEETRATAKEITLDVVLPAAVAEEPILSEPKAEAAPEVKETAILPTQANEEKTIPVVQAEPEVRVIPDKGPEPPSPPEEPKQNEATAGTSFFATYNNLVPLYEEFGGTGEVLTEITDRHLLKVLEQTTSQWWMVAYKSEIGWVNAQQIK